MMSEVPQKRAWRRIKLTPRLTVGIVIAVLALIFIFQNTNRTRVDLLFWHVDRPAWLWLLIVFAAGFIVGSIFPWFRRRARTKAVAPPDAEAPPASG
jgi:uncharacterized integral membrane protein